MYPLVKNGPVMFAVWPATAAALRTAAMPGYFANSTGTASEVVYTFGSFTLISALYPVEGVLTIGPVKPCERRVLTVAGE